MRSSISHIYDEYNTYVAFCKLVNEESVGVWDGFYKHEKELIKKYDYVKDGCWYTKNKSK
jgi:hypothetical protein